MKPTPASAAEAKERLDRGDRVQFVDAGNPTAWSESQVKLPGAIPISSARVAQILADSGVTDVHYIQGGFDAWRQAGCPLDPK